MAETKDCEIVEVMGRRWDSSRPAFFTAPAGLSLEDIVYQSIEAAYRDKIYNQTQKRVLLKYARCRVNGMEIGRDHWKAFFPQKGDRIEILHGVRGGGGGGGSKNPLATILSVLVVVVAAAATFWAGGAGAAIPFGLTAAQFTTGVGLVAAGMLMAINALFPAKPPSIGGLGGDGSAEKTSQTYSISGGKNAHNVDGYVPLILGKHRVTPPLGAKSWTSWHGGDQYFNMLVVWGHEHIQVSDFRIGDTALSKFSDVTHVFHQSTRGGGLKYFNCQYNEESVGATLSTSWVRRTVGEGTGISIDIEFPGGLTKINKNNGDKQSYSVDLELEYKPTSGGSWKGFPTKVEKSVSEASVTYKQSDLQGMVSVFYKSKKVQVVKRGQTVSGGIQLWPRPTIKGKTSKTGMAYLTGCEVSCAPSGSKLKVTVKPGVFKYNNKTYSVGGGKEVTRYSYSYDEWGDSYDRYTVITGKDTVVTMEPPFAIGISSSGKVAKGKGKGEVWPTKASNVSGCSVSWEQPKEYRSYWVSDEWGTHDYGGYYTTSNWKATVASGSITFATTKKATIKAAKQKQIVRNYQIKGLANKSWDVRIRRKKKESNDSYIIDACQWSTMRAIVQKPCFSTPVPICVSELHIKASEQLSGYVTEFSGLCHSKIPIWTGPTTKKVKGKTVTVAGHWNTWATTSNPAAIMRYLLTSKHSLIKPFSTKRLDNASLVALYKWCKKNDFRFDFVADSEENLWSRLVGVLAPAMAGPTTDVDGLWGAIIDQPNKKVKQLFTPRNSWGISIQRGFARLPDALRVKFVDEDDDYKQKEGFVYNDGYNADGSKKKKKANDVVEWSFEGVTDWKRIYKLGRYHLAQMLHRQMTVTLNTDWEWLAVHRGDLVGLSSDVLMNTFGTARVQRLVYRTSARIDSVSGYIYEDNNDLIDSNGAIDLIGPGESIPPDGKYIGIEIDDTVYYTSPKPARYGIAVRNSKGAINIIEIKPQYGEESSILYFSNYAKAAKTPPKLGDLVSVSLLGSEYEEYLVSSIAPGDNMSAQLTLVPYKTAEIMKAANSRIPAFSEVAILDQVKGAENLPTPTIKSVVSDERVAQVTASGAVQVCIGATWSLPATTENLSYFTIQCVATAESTGAQISGSSTNSDEYAIATGAKVGKKYYVKIRIHDPATGRSSPWSSVVTHTVAGLVMPPPTPQNVRAVMLYPSGIKISWDAVNVIDLRRYAITGAVEAKTTGKETEYVYAPTGQTGVLTYNVKALDTTDHLSKTAGTASVTVNPPQKPEITLARLENDGIVVTYPSAEGSWPIAKYEASCLSQTGEAPALRCIVPFPEDFQQGDKVKVRGVDAFSNAGSWSDPVAVTVVPPLTPEVTVAANENGTAVFRWQNCRTYSAIQHYVLDGAAKGTTTGLYAVLDVSKIIWEVLEENGASYRRGKIAEYVTAVDKYGFSSVRGSAEIYVWPPYNPVVSVERRTDGLYLTWQDCKRTFTVSHYVVKDPAFDLEYQIDGTSQALKPRAAGSYTFTVQAFDILGVASEEKQITQTLDGVGVVSPAAQIDGSDIVLTWSVPASSWPIDYYLVRDQANVGIDRSKTTTFRFPAPMAGSYEYSVVGKDIVGNWGPDGTRAAITVNPPVAPSCTAEIDGDGITVSWTAGSGTNTLPIVAWDVVRQWETESNGATVTHEVSYGRLDVDSLTIPAVAKGTHYFQVRGVDTAGVTGDWGDAYIDIAPPGKVKFENCSIVDNNVMLYWSAPDVVHLPIAYYLFESDLGDGDGYFAEIGRVDALFASTFETESGTYVYAVTPVDVAGNLGTRTSVTMQVAQPPDFILYHNYDSLFSGGNSTLGRSQTNGGKTNFVLDGEGHMVGPFADDTWNENLASMASAKSAMAADITWSQKIGWDWEFWMDPVQSSATYVEIVDVTGDASTLIPSSTITVTVDKTVLSGNPALTCRIETSQDAVDWTLISNDAFMVHASEFRYVRYTFSLSGGILAVSDINYRLDVKRRTDFGHAVSLATDNGAGYVDDATTPMLKGTWVNFNVAFTDVESLPKPNVVNNSEYSAYTVFEDVLNPQGFRVFVLDKNGNRVTAEVDWSAFGV